VLLAIQSRLGCAGAGLWRIAAEGSDPELIAASGLLTGEGAAAAELQARRKELIRAAIERRALIQLPVKFGDAHSTRSGSLCASPCGDGLIVEWLACGSPVAISTPEWHFITRALQLLSDDEAAEAADQRELLEQLLSIQEPDAFARLSVAVATRWLAADRAACLVQRSRSWEVLAVSDLQSFDPRSEPVRSWKHLADQLPLPATGIIEDSSQTPEVAVPIVRQHRELIGAQRVVVWPLGDSAPLLICEWFENTASGPRSAATQLWLQETLKKGWQRVAELQQSRQHPLQRWLREAWSSPGRKWLTLSMLLLIGLILLAVVPVKLELALEGVLQPGTRQDIYPPLPGLVEQVLVQHGAAVAKGEPLLQLRSDLLEQERQRLLGALATAEQQRVDLDTLRNDPTSQRERRNSSDAAADWAARSEELKVQIHSLQQQLRLLEAEISQLTIRSPLTGTVLTWDLEQLWQGRPVDPSQRLLSVASLEDDWELTLWIPQAELPAFRRNPELPQVRLLLPDRAGVLACPLVEVAPALEFLPQSGPVLPARGSVPAVALAGLLPGTRVRVLIECGSAPAGYVWFRYLIDWTRDWWALRFG
jgi:multidrug efflux pump subunit AcrA (membrane-fusion protein)